MIYLYLVSDLPISKNIIKELYLFFTLGETGKHDFDNAEITLYEKCKQACWLFLISMENFNLKNNI